jgi:hypothetical protein
MASMADALFVMTVLPETSKRLRHPYLELLRSAYGTTRSYMD